MCGWRGLMDDNFLQQFVKGPTHRACSKLDMLLCSRFEILSDLLTFSCDEHNFPTDHYIIEFRIHTKCGRAKPVRRIVNDYNKANFPKLRRALSQTTFDITLTDKIDNC